MRFIGRKGLQDGKDVKLAVHGRKEVRISAVWWALPQTLSLLKEGKKQDSHVGKKMKEHALREQEVGILEIICLLLACSFSRLPIIVQAKHCLILLFAFLLFLLFLLLLLFSSFHRVLIGSYLGLTRGQPFEMINKVP